MNISDIVQSPTVRRALVAVATAALFAANKRLGLDLGPAEIAGIASVVVGYLVQSGLKSKAQVEADAAAAGRRAAEDQIQSLEDVVAVLNKSGVP